MNKAVPLISGRFEFRKARLKFDAIAMDGYGRPNIATTLSHETLSSLGQMGLNEDEIDELITALERKIIEGTPHIQLLNDRGVNLKGEARKAENG
jgi:hypothetical protein